MKLIEWVRFSWDFAELPELDLRLPAHYTIEPATSENERELREVVSRCFRLDPVWSPSLHQTLTMIDSWLTRALLSEGNVCLALRHGARIIGASVLSLDGASENHLSPGPCVSMEYRNRGFGSRLLEHSFQALREAGMTQASGLTRANTSVARFLYPKFHGIPTPLDHTPLLAA